MSSSKKGKTKGKDITSQIFTATTEALPNAPRFGVGGEGGYGGYNRNGGRGGYANQYPPRNDMNRSSNTESGPAEYDWKRGSNAQPVVQGRVSTSVGEAPQRSAQPQHSLNDFDWSQRGTATQPQIQQRQPKEAKDTPQHTLDELDWSKRGTAQPPPQQNTTLPQREPKEAQPQRNLNDFDWSQRGTAQPQPQPSQHSNTSSLPPRERKEAQPQHNLNDFDWSQRGVVQQPPPSSLPISSTSHSSHTTPSKSINHPSDMDWSRKESQPPPPPPSSDIPSSLPDDNKPAHYATKDLDWGRRGVAQPKTEDSDKWIKVGSNGKYNNNRFEDRRNNDNRFDERRNNDNRFEDRRNNDNRFEDRRGDNRDGKRLLTREGFKGNSNWRKDNNTNESTEEIDTNKSLKPTEPATTTTPEKVIEKEVEVEKPKKEMPSLEELKELARQKNANLQSAFLEPANKKQTTTPAKAPVATSTPVKSSPALEQQQNKKEMPSLEELKERARQKNANLQSAFLGKQVKDLDKLFYYCLLNTFNESRNRRIKTSISELITNRKNDDTIEDIKELQLKDEEKSELIKEIIMDLCEYNKPEDHKLIYELIKRLFNDKLIRKQDIFCGLSVINNNKEDLKCDIPKIDEYYNELIKYLSKSELIDYEPISKDSEELNKYFDYNKYFDELKGEELTNKILEDNSESGIVSENIIIIIFEIFLSHLISVDKDEDKPIEWEEYKGVYKFPLLDDDNKYGNILKRLIGNVNIENNNTNIKEIQLKCIDLVCKYSCLLGHPIEWCESLFMNLYDKYVISEESFKEWKKSSEIEEKKKVLEDCDDFFDWLETAEYEE